jgi:streptogrisin C
MMQPGAGFLGKLMIAGVAAVAMAVPGSARAAAHTDEPPSAPAPDVAVDPVHPTGARLLTSNEALAEDAAAVAALKKIPVPEARRRLEFQAQVSRYIDTLPTASFASGRLDFSAGPRATLYFKGAVPAAAKRAAPAGVKLQGGLTYSAEELSARQNALHEAVTALGFTDVISAADIATQRVVIEVAQQAKRPELTGATLRSAAVNTLANRTRSAPVSFAADEFTITEHPASVRLSKPEHGYGGAGIRDDGTRLCTAGFVVRRNSDGVEGFLTDSHCEGINQIEENNTSGGVNLTFSAPFVSEHIGVNGDIEWHTTTHDDFPQFWSSNSSRRTVAARETNNGYVVGGLACHYGRFGGYSCGEISHVNRSVTFQWDGCNCSRTAQNLVGTTGATSTGGDSGGPWFAGNTAFGMHWGVVGGERVFSRAQRAESQFGVTIEKG